MDPLKQFNSFSKRLPHDKEMDIQKHRENNFNDDSYRKSKYCYRELLVREGYFYLEFRLKSSQLSQNKNRCTELIGLNQGIILNTIGLGDSSLKLTDSDIVTQIYEHFLRQISKICSDIHTLYFVQGLDASPVTQIERSLIYMQAALGKEIFKSSVIIATKWNKLDQDELEEKIKYLKEIADKYQIKGEVIDYRCPYKKIIKNKEQYGIPVTDEEFAKSKQELHKILMSLKFLEIKPHLEKLQNEIEKLKSEIKENSKYTREYFVKKERKERQWFSLWIVQHTMTYYEQQQETLFSKTDQDILEEAIDRGLQKNINEMKEALQQLSSQQ